MIRKSATQSASAGPASAADTSSLALLPDALLLPPPLDFVTQTGKTAVDTSESLRKMKEAKVVASGPKKYAEKRVGGRVMVYKDNRWLDQTVAGRSEVISIQFLSEGYFELLRLRPDLKEALSLGEEVELRLDAKSVLRIGAEGKTTLGDADRSLLKRTKPAKN